MRASRGALLVQVLIMGALLLILVMFLVRAVSQHYHIAAYVIGESRETQNAESAIGAVMSAWAANGSSCSSTTAVSCAANAPCQGPAATGSCQCFCCVTLNGVTLPNVRSLDLGGGNCSLNTDVSSQGAQFQYP